MTSSEDRKQIHANAVGEHRLPAVAATAVTIFLYAFLPSDIQALLIRPRAKLLLTLQSLLSFVLLALVIAHAVGALGG